MKHLLVLASIFVFACSGKAEPVGPTPPAAPGSASAPAGKPLVTADVIGYWSGDWGNLVFREKDGKVLGVYDHDDGSIVGTISGDMLVGWWCEVPSRKPNKDAGDVEMKFITNADGSRAIDGRWRYGTDGEWKDDWDIAWNAGPAPEELVKRFEDPAAFCPKP